MYQARYLLVSSVAARLAHSDASRVTTLLLDPFGGVLGIMYNRHCLGILGEPRPGAAGDPLLP